MIVQPCPAWRKLRTFVRGLRNCLNFIIKKPICRQNETNVGQKIDGQQDI